MFPTMRPLVPAATKIAPNGFGRRRAPGKGWKTRDIVNFMNFAGVGRARLGAAS
jgi:hypothetical protein